MTRALRMAFEQKGSRHYSAIAAFCEMNGLVYGKHILLRIMVLCGVTPKELLCTAVESMAPRLILSAQQQQEEEFSPHCLVCVCVCVCGLAFLAHESFARNKLYDMEIRYLQQHKWQSQSWFRVLAAAS
jgi:hypothetical protein